MKQFGSAFFSVFFKLKTDCAAKGATGAAQGAHPEIPSPIWTPFWSLWGDFLRFEKVFIFWCGSGAPFGSSWEAQWPQRIVNSSKNRGRACCAKVCCLSDLGSILELFWGSVGGKRAQKNASKKGYPPRRKRHPMSRPRGSLTAPLACAVF